MILPKFIDLLGENTCSGILKGTEILKLALVLVVGPNKASLDQDQGELHNKVRISFVVEISGEGRHREGTSTRESGYVSGNHKSAMNTCQIDGREKKNFKLALAGRSEAWDRRRGIIMLSRLRLSFPETVGSFKSGPQDIQSRTPRLLSQGTRTSLSTKIHPRCAVNSGLRGGRHDSVTAVGVEYRWSWDAEAYPAPSPSHAPVRVPQTSPERMRRTRNIMTVPL